MVEDAGRAAAPPPAPPSRGATRPRRRPTTRSAPCAPGTSRPSSATLLAEHPDAFKASLADNIRAGEALTGADVARAYAQRTTLAERMRAFFESYDVLVLPVSQVPPFPADQEFPAAINGQPMATYLDWMRVGVLHHRHRLPGDLGAGRADPRRTAGRRSRSSPPHGADRFLLEIAAAFEARWRLTRGRPASVGGMPVELIRDLGCCTDSDLVRLWTHRDDFRWRPMECSRRKLLRARHRGGGGGHGKRVSVRPRS